MSRIAFIGLGNMGLPMARNLQRAGHELHVFDTAPEAVAKAADEGMTAASSAADAAGNAEFIITMLPDGPAVLKVLDAVLPAAAKGAVLIDCSTIDVASARTLHDLAHESGLLSLDAPVSGGTAGAAAGTLTFMAGGSQDAFNKARPILEVMGAKIVHCGEGGSGQAAKICNNMLLAVSMIGACEAFALAERIVGPESPSDRDYAPGFATALMLKDLGLSQQAAREAGQATPMGAHALRLYQRFAAAGGADQDFSGIIEFLRTAEFGEA